MAKKQANTEPLVKEEQETEDIDGDELFEGLEAMSD
jgi:hypothetical protein